MIILLLLFLYGFTNIGCQDPLSYPGSLAAISPNSERREPLFAPSVCSENQLLYPGDQKTDWICDCAPGYVYYPKKDGCFSLYKQGPCQHGEYLMLHEDEIVPKCERNPCGKDGIVLYKGVCHELEKPGGPCERQQDTDPIKILTVVRGTLKLDCVTSTSGLSLIVVPSSCPPGSRRSNSNDCRRSVTDN